MPREKPDIDDDDGREEGWGFPTPVLRSTPTPNPPPTLHQHPESLLSLSPLSCCLSVLGRRCTRQGAARCGQLKILSGVRGAHLSGTLDLILVERGLFVGSVRLCFVCFQLEKENGLDLKAS